jgi:hypothetical protein
LPGQYTFKNNKRQIDEFKQTIWVCRGHNGPGGYVFGPASDNPDHTQLIWLLDTDLKGWIPKYIIDKALTGVMVTFFSALTAQVERLQQEFL